MPGQLSLFPTCPLPGCQNPATDPARPCDECLEAFGGQLRSTGRTVDADEYAGQLAERDAYVTQVYAGRREMTPLPEPEPEVQWHRNQMCWCCEERRSCRDDPQNPGKRVCRSCLDL